MMRFLSRIVGVVILGLIGRGVATLVPRFTIDHLTYLTSDNRGGYDIRTYSGHFLAEVNVSGDLMSATKAGVEILKGYILGNNAKTTNSPFTKSADQKASENIKLVTPVIAWVNFDKSVTVSFVMPDTYTTLSSLPTPNDSSIRLLPWRSGARFAVYSFNGKVTEEIFNKQSEIFLAKLQVDKVDTIGSPWLLRYDADWSIPYLQRNEIVVPIK